MTLGLLLLGCGPVQPKPPSLPPTGVRPASASPDDAGSAETLALFEQAPVRGLNGWWRPRPPRALRPCCVLGADVKVGVAGIPVPFVRLDNVVGPDRIGRHAYDGGLFSRRNGLRRAFLTTEKNGIIYTCRGGFADIAHLRDYADLTVFLAGSIEPLVEHGGTVRLPPYGGQATVVITGAPEELIKRVGRARLVVALASWAIFELSVWHESATWFGWSHYGRLFGEEVSSFSPEDLYSNLLAIKVAGTLLLSGEATSKRAYRHAMDVALAKLLNGLGAVRASRTRAAVHAVDGVWWSSRERVPERDALLRRSFGVGRFLRPWRLEDVALLPEAARTLEQACPGGPSAPLMLERSTHVGGTPIRDLVDVRIHVSSKIAERMPPGLLHDGELGVADIPAVVGLIRSENAALFGPGADRPLLVPSGESEQAGQDGQPSG